uniref:ADP-ribosyl cyclase/cyclic ADP-ribose hydrolase n=1 Tax=Quercus lobata TaxID=97700 RepID=A0A7N2LHY9_QUELO
MDCNFPKSIMECREKIGLIVLPIFYDVDPSEVRKLMGSYAEAFIEYEKNFEKNINKVHTWKATLTKVANLAGFSLQDRHESEFIQDIVKMILNKLSYTFLKGTKDLVGIDSRVEDLLPLLVIGSNDVRIIGVWGMGGIGKTTFARVVYQNFFEEFEDCSFITNINISEESKKYGIPHPQDVNDKVLMIKNRLYNKRILLVLDDVHQFDQLEKLAREPNWFGLGSRVIITMRDKHLLTRLKVYGIYEAKGLSNDDDLQLFSLNAFSNDHPAKDYLELYIQFVNYAKGLPLAIEVLGSFLINRSTKEWVSTLDRLKQFPEKKINNTLQIGFDGLEDTEKEIFIHIACFFNMKNKDYVVKILECLGLHPDIGIRILIEKSLLKEYENKLWMHELLQIMGQDIVRRDFPQEPRKWSKLWLYEDIHNVLMKNMGTEAIKGLVLDLYMVTELGELHKSKEAYWNPDAFSKMPNLELLIIYVFNRISLLNFTCHSKVEQLWKGKKYLDKLKFIELNNSLSLIETPDFTGVPNLEKFVVKGCIGLIKVRPSVVVHKRLTLLDLEGCKNLRSLPKKFEMESLEILNLSNCSKIKRILEFMGNMECLSKLHLDGTAITKLPSSVEHLTNLAVLHLRDYKEPTEATISTFIPGSEIMEWFNHQSMGNMVKSQVTSWKQNVNIQMPIHSCNKWMGMAACAVFSPLDLYPKNYSFFKKCHIICYIEVGVGELAKLSINYVQISSHHLWLLYFRLEFFDENARAVLSQIDENESIQLEVRFQFSRESDLEFEKCGFQMVYEQDMDDIRELAYPSNISCITSYEDVDAQHDLDNSMLVTEEESNIYKGRIGHCNSDCLVHSIEGGSRLVVWLYSSYPGGLTSYIKTANELLADSKAG